MKMIDGLASLAILKSYLINFSDSPIHLLTKSEELIEKKAALKMAEDPSLTVEMARVEIYKSEPELLQKLQGEI